MKIKQGFSLKTEDGQTVIVCDKSINHDFNSTIFLTDTAIEKNNLIEMLCFF